MSGTARTGTQEFASLLKQSKVLQLTPKQPVALTSYGGYLHRGDFGLKRPLPAAAVGKTPYIRLTSGIDGSDFVSSAKQALFVSRWDESGLVADQSNTGSSKRLIESSPFDNKSDSVASSDAAALRQRHSEFVKQVSSQEQERIFDAVMGQEAEQQIVFDPPLSEAGQAFYQSLQDDALMVGTHQMPNIAAMSDREFEEFVAYLESLPSAFKMFLESRMSQRLEAAPVRSASTKRPPSEQLAQAAVQPESPSTSQSTPKPRADLLQQAQQTTTRASTPDFLDFLTTASASDASQSGADYIPPQPHPTAALNYTPPNVLHQTLLQRPLPARYIQNKSRDKGYFKQRDTDRNISVTMGVTSSTQNPDAEQGITQFLPPLNANNQRVAQNRNKAAGLAWAEVASIPKFPEEDGFSDGSNEAHAFTYAFERRLSNMKQYQQLAKQSEPQGRPAKLPQLSVTLLSKQALHKYPAVSNVHRALLVGSLGSPSYVQGPSDAEMEQSRQSRMDASVKQSLIDALNGAQPSWQQRRPQRHGKKNKQPNVRRDRGWIS